MKQDAPARKWRVSQTTWVWVVGLGVRSADLHVTSC